MSGKLIALSILAATVPFWCIPSGAHDWYPKECCHDTDCAPVENIARVMPTDGGVPQLIVTSKHGSTVIPQNFRAQESKDGRAHVCMRQNEFGSMDLMCLFVPQLCMRPNPEEDSGVICLMPPPA